VSGDADFFASLTADLQSEPDPRLTVQRAVGYVRALARCDEAAVRLHHVADDGLPYIAATTRRGELLERLRDHHPSPGVGIARAGRRGSADVVATARAEERSDLVDDTARDERWPGWSRDLAAAGVGTTLTLPLAARGDRIGLLTLYAATPGVLRRVDDEPLRLLVRQVAVALAALRAAEDLESVRESRTLVGQAQGILMERHGLDADTAFAVLRRYSQRGNVKLREVAAQLVETRSLPDETRWSRPGEAPDESPARRRADRAAGRAPSSADGTPASA
jgi:GAF domain-containing protein